ncbi:hypothetical protein F511_46874 [Dorcoceras hygrometricum]|uniref:Uncharacterized protein n=1 Tax=Dorcoceras hygrometricum TaxID=472368 RepID=A0A2Z6ZTH8_9LAMI|nr:hypothetical protein F511_46874 [Dorcoceras hygrometricum]
MTFIGRLESLPCWQLVPGSDRFRKEMALHACTRRPDEIYADGFSSSNLAETISGEEAAAAASGARWRRRDALRRRGGGSNA